MALYHEPSNKALELAYIGRLVYKAINQTTVLDRVIRQGSNNARSSVFRSALVELYNDAISELT